MCRKMTRLALGVKCGCFGASGSVDAAAALAARFASAASRSETMPGSRSELPASERMALRRVRV